MAQHKASQIAGLGQPAVVVSVPTPSPAENQVLVRAHAWAVNPIDHAIRDAGFWVSSWPAIAGYDAAGEIAEVGPGVTSHKVGDRVIVVAPAAFQELVLAPAVAASKIPDSLTFEKAVVASLSVATAAAGLYESDVLALDLPSLKPKPNGKKLLVWGAGSSVAASAIQLATFSGYEVIATSSSKHFDYVKSLGASEVFDYKSPNLVDNLTKVLSGGVCVGAYDAISTQETQLAIATVLAQIGGGKIAYVLQPLAAELVPATVEVIPVQVMNIFAPGNPVAQAILQEFLPQALASGQFLPRPEAEIFGHGIEAIEGAINRHKAGVSATKIVVTAYEIDQEK